MKKKFMSVYKILDERDYLAMADSNQESSEEEIETKEENKNKTSKSNNAAK